MNAIRLTVQCFPSNGFLWEAFNVKLYILASSACLYKIYIINKVFTEFRLLISVFYCITT